MVDRNLQVLEQHVIPEDLVTPVIGMAQGMLNAYEHATRTRVAAVVAAREWS